jgi:hypothetical protein
MKIKSFNNKFFNLIALGSYFLTLSAFSAQVDIPSTEGAVCTLCAEQQQIKLNPIDTDQIKNNDGVAFQCQPDKLKKISSGMRQYLKTLDINENLVNIQLDLKTSTLRYSLKTDSNDTNTLDLKDRPEFNIHDESIQLPASNGQTRTVKTVSKKEILLALMQHGRSTQFSHKSCDLESLKDHVGIRQNVVAWAEELEWGWPEGGPAKWNTKYWEKGTPKKGVHLLEALTDAFKNQKEYEIGCYTATKIVYAQGVLDYYGRVKKDPVMYKKVTQRLLHKDNEPLVDLEPGKMWYFEKDFDPQELNRPGKILSMKENVSPKNFVPGDWSYFLNTDPTTYEKTGYEGSNSIYLGRNKFDDYYNDNNHSYSFREKLDEVYQWRNHVFSRSRDGDKIEKLSEERIDHLTKTPNQGGLILNYRVYPTLLSSEDGK